MELLFVMKRTSSRPREHVRVRGLLVCPLKYKHYSNIHHFKCLMMQLIIYNFDCKVFLIEICPDLLQPSINSQLYVMQHVT